jgi:hypothetical protein
MVNDGGRLDPPARLAADAERRASEVRLPRLMPAMVVTTLGSTAAPAVSPTLLLDT